MGVLLVCVSSVSAFGAEADGNWPTWRGPNFDGIMVEGNPPLTWSETENVKCKVPMPDTANSTPVLWGDRMFFLSNEPTAGDERTPPPEDAGREIYMPMPAVPYWFNVVCLSRKDGSTLLDPWFQ